MKNSSSDRRRRRPGIATRALVLEEAERLLIEVGYEKASVSDIAKILGMSPANVFKHFKSKADLAYAVIAKRLTANSTTEPTEGKSPLRTLLFDILRELIEFATTEPRLFAVFATMISAEDAAALLRQRLLLELQETVKDVRLPLDKGAFLDALADILLCVLHPCLVATTAETALWMRAENVMLMIDLAMTGPQPTKPQAEGVADENL